MQFFLLQLGTSLPTVRSAEELVDLYEIAGNNGLSDGPGFRLTTPDLH